MRSAALLAATMAFLTPALATAQDAPQPKFPPGFDCATLTSGEEREACEQSQLNPTMDSKQEDRDITGAGPETPGSVSPPTFPDEPGNENRDGGPGAAGSGVGVGN